MLKRSPSLTEQAKAHIKELILDGQYEDGRIPSESDLASELGVSRTTIRDALSRLEIEGTVFRKQGSGTFVNSPGLQIKSKLDEIWSYEAMLEAHGYVPAVSLLGIERSIPAAAVQTALELGPKEEVMIVRKLFSENAVPVIFTENQIPQRLIPDGAVDDLLMVPVYDLLQSCCQQHLNYYVSEIVPVVADQALAAMLETAPGTALLSFEETGYNDENEPILWARSVFRDDLLRFRMIRRTIN